MDTVFVTNISESVLTEPVHVVVNNVPDTLSVAGTVQVCNDTWGIGFQKMSDSISTVRTIITDIAANQYSLSDSVAIIAIPMIIAIIAFAVPYIVESINRINERYHSETISEILEHTCLYKSFWWLVWICGIGVLVFALLFLFLWRFLSVPAQYGLNFALIGLAITLVGLTFR